MPEGELKVPRGVAVLMTGIAFLFDVVNIASEVETVGIGGLVMDVISTATFSIWFHHYEVNVWSGNNVGNTLLTVFLDGIPLGDLTFPWTRKVAYTAFTEKKEVPQQAQSPTVSAWRL